MGATEKIEEYAHDQGMPTQDAALWLSGLDQYYGGPGRPFGDEPIAVVGRRRVLVLQRVGLDI